MRVGQRSLPPTSQLATLGGWLAFAERVYADAGLALGQVATTAHDEALYLLLHTLGWPMDSGPETLSRRLEPEQRRALRSVLERRVVDRTPAAYLTGEAWLGPFRFVVDERVLIPRSYFLEHIGPPLDVLLGRSPGDLHRVADVCTGSGCLAVLLARHYPRATVDAIDLSEGALEVAKLNLREHRLLRRIRLHRSDVFAAVAPPDGGYDLIVSNPPYEPSAVCDALPEEFRREPRLALDGGSDGLDIIRRLVRESAERLAPGGVLAIEVGGLRTAMTRAFRGLRLRWLPAQDGSACVCAIAAEDLREWAVR
jgi:ribosomal protein L3 glutamine methyltransferase